MTKTNFTKVEEALAEGMQKMNVNKLLNQADEAQKGEKTPENPQALTVAFLKHEIKWFSKHEADFFKKLGLDKKRIRSLLEQKEPFTKEQATELEQIKKKVEAHKAKLTPKDPGAANETVIETELKNQKNKRFNVQDKWLPLH